MHSWNGKYRRPAGLVTPDYSEPMKGDLLWVYEGLTQYLGEVLTLLAATGFRIPPRSSGTTLAMSAAGIGPRSRTNTGVRLQDTAVSAQLLYESRDDYAAYRRSVDYYDEGSLLWLEADVLIRQLSHGSKSLNDFCRAFAGGPGGAPALKPYTFDDVVATLNSVQPYDWATLSCGSAWTWFSRTLRWAALKTEAGSWPTTPSRSDLWRDTEDDKRRTDLSYSIGLIVKEDGTVQDVAVGGPAQKAGIAPDDKLIAVDNRQFTPLILREAVQKHSGCSGANHRAVGQERRVLQRPSRHV